MLKVEMEDGEPVGGHDDDGGRMKDHGRADTRRCSRNQELIETL